MVGAGISVGCAAPDERGGIYEVTLEEVDVESVRVLAAANHPPDPHRGRGVAPALYPVLAGGDPEPRRLAPPPPPTEACRAQFDALDALVRDGWLGLEPPSVDDSPLLTVGEAALASYDDLKPLLRAAADDLGMRIDLALRGARKPMTAPRRYPNPQAGGTGRFPPGADRDIELLALLDRVDGLQAIYAAVPVARAGALLLAVQELLGRVVRDRRVINAVFGDDRGDVLARRSAVVALGVLSDVPPVAATLPDPSDEGDDQLAERIFATRSWGRSTETGAVRFPACPIARVPSLDAAAHLRRGTAGSRDDAGRPHASDGVTTMTGLIRKRFMRRVHRITRGRLTRVPGTGSRSLCELGPGEPLVLVRAGTLDREARLYTHVRRADAAALLARRGSVVCLLAREFREPLVVPAAILLAHRGPGGDPIRVHVRLGRQGDLTLVETGRDLVEYIGWAHLTRLAAAPAAARIIGGAGLPVLTHPEWQTVVAALGRRHGFHIWVPAADRSRLSAALFRRAGGRARRGTGRLDRLPAAAAGIGRLSYADVVLTRRGAASPTLVLEVEVAGDITAALARSADTLAALRARGVHPLPRFAVVAEGRRRGEFEAKLRAALHAGPNGLAARCRFWALEGVWAAYRRRP